MLLMTRYLPQVLQVPDAEDITSGRNYNYCSAFPECASLKKERKKVKSKGRDI